MNAIEYSGRTYRSTATRARWRVLACTLSARNYFSSFADCREDAFFHALADGVEIQTLHVRSSAISQSRNLCVERWKERDWGGKPPEFLLFLDDDMIFPPTVISDLLRAATEHHADVVGVLATGRAPPFPVCVLKKENLQSLSAEKALTLHEAKAVVEVGAVGMACTLIRTSLLHELQPPYFSFYQQLDDAAELIEAVKKTLDEGRVPDTRILTRAVEKMRHHVVGEDYSFCVKASRAGGKVMCDFGVGTPYQGGVLPGLGHLGSYPFSLREAIAYSRATGSPAPSRAGGGPAVN